MAPRRKYLVCLTGPSRRSAAATATFYQGRTTSDIYGALALLGEPSGYVIGETAAIVTKFDANHAERFQAGRDRRMDHHHFPPAPWRKVRRSYKIYSRTTWR